MIGRSLVRLYPADWRARYGDEFLDLLESRPPNLMSVIDVILGALDAHLDPQVAAGGGPFLSRRVPMSTRLLGAAAVGSGMIVILGILLPVEDGLTYRLLLFYSLTIAGMVGVHVRQVGANPALAWLAFAPAVTFAAVFPVGILVDLVGGGPTLSISGQVGFFIGVGFWVSAMVLGIVTAIIGGYHDSVPWP